MSQTVKIDVEPLGLENIGGPDLAAQFERGLDSIVSAFENYDDHHGGGKVKASMSVSLAFVFDSETNSTTLKATVKVNPPKSRSVTQTAMVRGGRMLVQPNGNQMPLLSFHHDSNPQPAPVAEQE